MQGERAELDFTIDGKAAPVENGTGRLKTFKLPRWGNPDGAEFRYVDFGGKMARNLLPIDFSILDGEGTPISSIEPK